MQGGNIYNGSTLLQFHGIRFEKPTIPNGYTTYEKNLWNGATLLKQLSCTYNCHGIKDIRVCANEFLR
ncbi:hypothetical protein MXB_723 [Myxobolus squamalis]|nr:hypothetical protein MXB_723 [Myxobolus squamalis]